jgi:hypothetical protein
MRADPLRLFDAVDFFGRRKENAMSTNDDNKIYPPVDPGPNYTQAVGTVTAAAGFGMVVMGPLPTDTVDQGMMSWAADLFSSSLTSLGFCVPDSFAIGLGLIGVGIVLNFVSLAQRPRVHFLTRREQYAVAREHELYEYERAQERARIAAQEKERAEREQADKERAPKEQEEQRKAAETSSTAGPRRADLLPAPGLGEGKG